jgi:hypothetical protein
LVLGGVPFVPADEPPIVKTDAGYQVRPLAIPGRARIERRPLKYLTYFGMSD